MFAILCFIHIDWKRWTINSRIQIRRAGMKNKMVLLSYVMSLLVSVNFISSPFPYSLLSLFCHSSTLQCWLVLHKCWQYMNRNIYFVEWKKGWTWLERKRNGKKGDMASRLKSALLPPWECIMILNESDNLNYNDVTDILVGRYKSLFFY